MNNINIKIGRISVVILLVSIMAGCVYSKYGVNLFERTTCVEGGELIIAKVRREERCTIIYPPYYSLAGNGHDGMLLFEILFRIPTFIPEMTWAMVFDRENWEEDVRVPLFEKEVFVPATEVFALEDMEGRKVELEVGTKNSFETSKVSGRKCLIEFHEKSRKLMDYGVELTGVINDGFEIKKVDFGYCGASWKIFSCGRYFYIIGSSGEQKTKWLWYCFKNSGPVPMIWRVDPFTGQREVMVSFDSGKLIIENPPQKVMSKYGR